MEIAILDSGINPWHSHVQSVKGGLGFVQTAEGTITLTPDFSDHLGHGTAIAGVIRAAVPAADLFAFKIFHDSLRCPAEVLLKAIDWAIEANIKIIHLSLGTVEESYKADLERLSQKAYQKKIIMVAAARGYDDEIYPAVFDTVIGVYWYRRCPEGSLLYHPDAPISFGAYGRPRKLPGQAEAHNYAGSSFAAAHVSAMVARILAESPRTGPDRVKQELIKRFGTMHQRSTTEEQKL